MFGRELSRTALEMPKWYQQRVLGGACRHRAQRHLESDSCMSWGRTRAVYEGDNHIPRQTFGNEGRCWEHPTEPGQNVPPETDL